VLTTTNPLNQVTRYDYLGVNNVPVQDGDGATFGQMRVITDANGAATQHRYDPHGRLTQMVRPYADSGWGCDRFIVPPKAA
jgi:YD repeat-containing protein